MKYIILIFFTSLTMQLYSQQVVDRIVGQVGGQLVLLSEIEEMVAYMKDAQKTVTEQDYCAIIHEILSQKLLINQAILDSIAVTDVEVEAQLDARVDQILGYMNNDVTQFENYYGKSISEVKSEMRTDLKNQLLAQRMQQQIASTYQATPKEVVEYYNSIPTDSLPYYSSEVEIQELVVKPKITDEQEKEIITRLLEMKEQILAGASFADMASKYSDDPGSAQKGGTLGMMKRGALAQEYEAAAYNLDINEISDPVKTQFGYHIIQLLERRGNNFSTRHILIRPEITEENINTAIHALDSIRNLIVTDSIHFEEGVEKIGYQDIPSYSYGGRVINPKTGDSFFEVGDLDFKTYFAIDTIEVGDVTQPFPYKNERGDQYVKIVRLMSRTQPHKASLKTDFARIQVLASSNKKQEVFERWVEETLKTTYVTLDLPYHEIRCKELKMWKTHASASSK